jgi:hypothetical protein
MEPWMTDALVSGLGRIGCPPETADRLMRETRIERPSGAGSPDEWTVLLQAHGLGFVVPVDADQWAAVASGLVENVAADDAGAHDRAARGGAGRTPLWSLPERRPRRR